jgi:hypothetical protein
MTFDTRRFAALALVLVTVVVVGTAVRSSPDPFTQLVRVVPGVLVALVVAYAAAR